MRRRYEIVDQFVNFAFYGSIPEDLEMSTIYESYKVYCKLFEIEELTKFDFIQEMMEWRK